MKIYQNRQDVLEVLVQHLEVSCKSYGSWIIKSYLGDVEVSYLSYNEEDSIGIFDGAKYYPQNYNEWVQEYAQYEIENYEQYHEEELIELFNEWCQKLWSDLSNENNYEPTEERFKRLAENLLDDLFRNLPENIFDTVNGKLVVLTEEEKEFIYSDTYYIGVLQEERFNEYIKAFKVYLIK